MKKVFLAIAVASVFTACNNGSTDAAKNDSTVKTVDSTMKVVDSTVKKVDSTVKKVDSTVKAKVDSAKKM